MVVRVLDLDLDDIALLEMACVTQEDLAVDLRGVGLAATGGAFAVEGDTNPFRGKPALVRRMASGSSPQLAAPEDPTTAQATKRGAQPLRRPFSQAPQRGPVPELPGFGDYLVTTGILTRERLRAAQAYQRSMKVQLSTAIVTLGLAAPQRIEWAAVAHQSQLARGR